MWQGRHHPPDVQRADGDLFTHFVHRPCGACCAGAAGATPMVLPWLLLAALAGIVAIGFWVGHRVSHRSRVMAAPAAA